MSLYTHESLKCKLKSFVPDAQTPSDAIAAIKRSGMFPKWQWTGVTEFGIVLEWCEEQFGDDFIWNFETVYFKYERDYTVFALRWA